MKIKVLILATLTIVLSVAANAQHKVINGRLDGSELYPGTVHTYKVVVPDGYKSGEEAALYIGLDGILCNAPAVIDSLIAIGKMPMTISVFLQPGVVYDSKGEVARYNRSNEFDATDGRFAEFLENELLPAVLAIELEDGRKIKFSPRAEDHMIFGLSSGGIAAFNTAWHRPDLFAKVYSGCGTFVPMRGGNDLQAIVRKHEPHGLRIFLQDGFTDTWNPIFGSWYEANRRLASALEFAGYDCKFDWAPGGHSVVRTSEIFPDVMVWMWRDHPAKIKANPTGNGLLKELLIEGEDWIAEKTVAEIPDSKVVEAIYPGGSLVAVTVPGSNFIDQYVIDNGIRKYGQRYYWLHTYDNSALKINSMAFDGDGWLWVLTKAGLQICDHNGRVRGIIKLPLKFDAEHGKVIINEGIVSICDSMHRYTRRFNVKANIGVKPKSQGAA